MKPWKFLTRDPSMAVVMDPWSETLESGEKSWSSKG